MPQPVIGCDLSRAFLDLCDLRSCQPQRIPNTRDAIAKWTETPAPDILIAVTRQLLVILNAMIQKRQPLQVT